MTKEIKKGALQNWIKSCKTSEQLDLCRRLVSEWIGEDDDLAFAIENRQAEITTKKFFIKTIQHY